MTHPLPATYGDADQLNNTGPTYLGTPVTITAWNQISGKCTAVMTTRRGRVITFLVHADHLEATR